MGWESFPDPKPMSTDRALNTHSKNVRIPSLQDLSREMFSRQMQQKNQAFFPKDICITFKVLNFPFHHKGIILLYLKRPKLNHVIIN